MGCERICELPDILLTLILTFLPTKDSIRTSVLSKRWKFLWLKVLALDFRSNDLPCFGEVFSSFMEKFHEFNQELQMQSFKIVFDQFNTYPDRCLEWISREVDHGVQHLDVEAFLFLSYAPIMPLNIYKSNTLVTLRLVSVVLKNPELDVSLPCLKIIRLHDVSFDGGPIIMEKLISGSSSLEDLTIVTYHENYSIEAPLFLYVRSKTLKRFCFKFKQNLVPHQNCLVEIDAPRLEYLSFIDNQSERIVIKNLSSLVKVDIDSDFNVVLPFRLGNSSNRDTIRDFLTGISRVRHMIISPITLQVLYQYARFEQIPKFNNLCSFHVMLSRSFFRVSVFLECCVLLECCPNLKHFILDVSGSLEPEESELLYVPQCFLWTLETVEIKELRMEEETWKKLARYFIENSGVLKKLILHFRNTPTPNQASDMFKGLLPISMRSRMCEINFY